MSTICITFFLLLQFVACGYTSNCQTLTARQKEKIDSSINHRWYQIEEYHTKFSRDGRFILYCVVQNRVKTFCILDLKSNHQESLSEVAEVDFSNNSKEVIILQTDGSLRIRNLLTKQEDQIDHATKFEVLANSNKFVYYRSDSTLLVYDPIYKNTLCVQDVISMKLGDDGTAMLIHTVDRKGTDRLLRINLQDFTNVIVWEGSPIKSFIINSKSNQIAVAVKQNNSIEVWLFSQATKRIKMLLSDSLMREEKRIEIVDLFKFNESSDRLFLHTKEMWNYKSRSESFASVNVWSYNDAKLQSQQLNDVKLGLSNNLLLATIRLNNPSSFLQLQTEGEKLEDFNDRYVITSFRAGEKSESYWNVTARSTSTIISIESGERFSLPIARCKLSPGGRFVVGFDSLEVDSSLVLYDIAKRTSKLLTVSIPPNGHSDGRHMPSYAHSRGFGIECWLDQEAGILIHDNFDVWRIDFNGVYNAINLTNSGASGWQYRMIDKERNLTNQDLYKINIKGFNIKTKQEGFFRLDSRKPGHVTKLLAGGYSIKILLCQKPSISKSERQYCISLENVKHSPNLFVTSDLRNLRQVTDVFPERIFNWMSSELIEFPVAGTSVQAIMYKPDNFDSTRKYPVIFHYYDQRTDGLNTFLHPVIPYSAEINIPWFVSNEYIVVVPDMYYKIGNPGWGIHQTIANAIKHLSHMSYIDLSRLGLHGHSFAGWETNYLLTRLHNFAAVVSSCGVSDITSGFGSLWPNGSSAAEYYEQMRFRLGIVTPWENSKIFVENSPIYFVNQIRAPVLLMANRDDYNVRFEQGLQFYLGLRRAGKLAWMLEYDNGGHGLMGNDYTDYTIRTAQFFDHYLKDSAAPRWMLFGVPLADKGNSKVFELVRKKQKNGKWLTPSESTLLTVQERRRINAIPQK